jgi:transposase InsO family protein
MDTTTLSQTPARVYFRPTTVGQRQLLFSTAEETGNVSEAARRAHVSRGTYYYWQSRYESDGAAGLAGERSRAPHHTRIPPVSTELRAEVLAYHQAHPAEGYRSIANGIGKAHEWQKTIGHTKVREIILAEREGHSPPPAPAAPSVESFHLPTEAVHAPRPNQTINIDLCVVPLTHDGTQDMVSVSLSAAAAGVILTENDSPATSAEWPGQTFENTALSYEEQMRDYVEKRTAKRLSKGQRKHRRRQKQAERAELNAQSDELRLKRRRQRAKRRQEDADWKAKRQAHRDAERAWRNLSKEERRERRAERQAQQAQWRADKAERQAQGQQRQAEDAAWRQARREIRDKLAQLAESVPLVTAWLAILVMVDNGTRRCLGLPLFTAGVHVTAEMIVAALRALCPPELQFVISDNGAQFIAEAFAQFAQEMAFVHVRIAPYRARTNGIAERFVRTLKEWLEAHSWNSPEELAALLVEFIEYYNDRPHQGAELDGLSPNEFARRLADCSTC